MDPSGLASILIALVGAWLVLVAMLWILRPRDVRVTELVRVIPDLLRLVRSLLSDR